VLFDEVLKAKMPKGAGVIESVISKVILIPVKLAALFLQTPHINYLYRSTIV
jgi:hypothetical protein